MKNSIKYSHLSVAISAAIATFGLSPTSAQAQAGFVLEEVVVTARKREESAQDVPVAVTVFTGDELDKRGISEFTDLTMNNPNVSIRNGANGPLTNTVAIRGNVQNDATVQLDAAVGTYIDGFVVARTFAMNGSMVDIETVQSLKGPQGTLFGRNTTGGAVLITTKNPELGGDVSGYVKGELGEIGTQSYTGAVNIPLSDSVAVRVVAQHSERDNYLKYSDGTELGESESQTLRAKLLWEITDTTTAIATAERTSMDALNTTVIATQPNEFDFEGMPNVGGVYLGGLITTPAIGSDEKQSADIDTYNLTITHETEWGEIKFLNGVRKMDVSLHQSLAPGLGFTAQDKPGLKQFSSELQLNGTFFDDKVELTSGLYYFDEETHERQLTETYPEINTVLPFPPVLTNVAMDTDMKSISLYVQGTYALTETTNLTLGGRYTDDDRETTGFNQRPPRAPVNLIWEGQEKEFNYLITLDHNITDDAMIYVTTSTGYRSGAAAIIADASKPGYWGNLEPESITNYETGIKSDWLDGRVRFNGALFYQDYTDYQYTQIIIDPNSGGPVRNGLSNDVTIKGGEAELTLVLPGETLLVLDYGYTDGEIKGSGADLPNIPKVSIGASIAKSIPLENGDVDLRAVYDYRDDLYTQVGQEANSTTEDRALINLSATYSTESWSATAYVNNVTDEEYYNHITYSPASPAAAGLFGLSFTSVGLPRVAGVKVSYNF